MIFPPPALSHEVKSRTTLGQLRRQIAEATGNEAHRHALLLYGETDLDICAAACSRQPGAEDLVRLSDVVVKPGGVGHRASVTPNTGSYM